MKKLLNTILGTLLYFVQVFWLVPGFVIGTLFSLLFTLNIASQCKISEMKYYNSWLELFWGVVVMVAFLPICAATDLEEKL